MRKRKKHKRELTNNIGIPNLTRSTEKHVRNSFIHVTDGGQPGWRGDLTGNSPRLCKEPCADQQTVNILQC